MALTYVGGNSGSWAGATSGDNNVSLTALTGGSDSSAASGDIVVAVYATSSTADRTLAIGDGTNPYTTAGSELYVDGTSRDANLLVAYKVLSAADANCVFGPTGNANDAGAAVLHVWRGVDATTQMDVAVVTATGTGDAYPNAASITPTTSGAVVIVCGGNAAGGQYLLAQSGAELSNFIAIVQNDLNDASAGIGSYAWSSGAFDPAAWTASSTAVGASWAAITLALRPGSAATHATTGALTGAGSTVAGTAAHIAKHATSGALVGPGSTVAGTATRTATHATSGALVGPGSVISGTAAHIAIHATSGILIGAGAVIAGSAAMASGAATRLKYWDGSAWQTKTLKYWDGGTWATKTLKYWNGSSWLS